MKINSTINILPIRQDIHVVPSNGSWRLKKENWHELSSPYSTKLEAMAEGIRQARMSYVSLVIHGQNGRIQEVWTYDTFPD